MSHQVIVLNSSLKMSKGKAARVCAFLSANLMNNHNPDINSMYRGIVLKTNYYEYAIAFLKEQKIPFVCHIDAGHTQVAPLSNCGLSFIYPKGKKLGLIDELKLY